MEATTYIWARNKLASAFFAKIHIRSQQPTNYWPVVQKAAQQARTPDKPSPGTAKKPKSPIIQSNYIKYNISIAPNQRKWKRIWDCKHSKMCSSSNFRWFEVIAIKAPGILQRNAECCVKIPSLKASRDSFQLMRQLKDVIFNLLVQSTIYSSLENLPSDRMYQLTTMGTYFLEDVSYYMRTSGKDVPVDWELMQIGGCINKH